MLYKPDAVLKFAVMRIYSSFCLCFQTFHDMGLICVVGGTNIHADIRKFNTDPSPDILVATPGRLNDHLDNHNLARGIAGLKYLIFDEADQARWLWK